MPRTPNRARQITAAGAIKQVDTGWGEEQSYSVSDRSATMGRCLDDYAPADAVDKEAIVIAQPLAQEHITPDRDFAVRRRQLDVDGPNPQLVGAPGKYPLEPRRNCRDADRRAG